MSFIEENEKFENNLNFNKAYKPLYGIVSPSDLSTRFFGEENVSKLQNLIRYLVYRKTDGVVIEPQNPTHLMNIMRTVYLGYSVNINNQEQLDRLNKLVLQEAVPNLIDTVKAHQHYLNVEFNNVSLSVGEPVDTSSRGLKLDYAYIPRIGRASIPQNNI